MMNIEWLLEQGPCKKIAAGELIPCPCAKPGEQKAMFILLSGAIDVFGKNPAGGMKKTSSVTAGDVFGGREYFAGPTELLYRASEECVIYILTEESFSDLSWSQPAILFEILKSAYMPPKPPVQAAAPQSPIAAAKAAAAAKPAPVTAKPAAGTPAQPAASAPAGDPTVDRAAVQAKVAAQAKAAKDGKTIRALQLPGHKKYNLAGYPVNNDVMGLVKYTCPFCRKEFNDYRVQRTKLRESSPVRYDLRRFYENFNAEWYDIITCPHCYFSMFQSLFTEPKPLKRTEFEEYLLSARYEMPIDFSAPRDINRVITMHYIALLCCEGYPNLGKQLTAKVWGNLSWLYEDVADSEPEIAAAGKAAAAYELVYAETRQSPAQEQIVCLSVAGMQKRAGIDRDMARYLYTAKKMEMGDRTYTTLAENLMNELSIADEGLTKMAKR